MSTYYSLLHGGPAAQIDRKSWVPRICVGVDLRRAGLPYVPRGAQKGAYVSRVLRTLIIAYAMGFVTSIAFLVFVMFDEQKHMFSILMTSNVLCVGMLAIASLFAEPRE
jgi:hypothetical protein